MANSSSKERPVVEDMLGVKGQGRKQCTRDLRGSGVPSIRWHLGNCQLGGCLQQHGQAHIPGPRQTRKRKAFVVATVKQLRDALCFIACIDGLAACCKTSLCYAGIINYIMLRGPQKVTQP